MTRKNVATPGPYVGRNGNVYYAIPHAEDFLVAVCNESDPVRVAEMLNFSIANGFNGIDKPTNGAVPKKRKSVVKRRRDPWCVTCGDELIPIESGTGLKLGTLRCVGCQTTSASARNAYLKKLATPGEKVNDVALRLTDKQKAARTAAGKKARDARAARLRNS